MSDPLDLVRELAPDAEASPELIERVRNDLMAIITDTPPRHDSASTPNDRRARRGWLIPVAAALVLATAATAWALTRTTADSTTLECPGSTIINAVTGDPVADCSNEWRRSMGTQPPAMIAYDNGRGGVSVLLATDHVPDEYRELGAGPFLNPALIQLDAALGDAGRGLSSGCYDAAAAEALARAELDRLGLVGWTVTVDGARRPDGETRCATFALDAATQQLQLIGLAAGSASNPYTPYARSLAADLDATCMNLDEAAASARSLAAESVVVIDGVGIEFTEDAGVLVVNQVEDPLADCTRSAVTVGGRVEVTLRGPAS